MTAAYAKTLRSRRKTTNKKRKSVRKIYLGRWLTGLPAKSVEPRSKAHKLRGDCGAYHVPRSAHTFYRLEMFARGAGETRRSPTAADIALESYGWHAQTNPALANGSLAVHDKLPKVHHHGLQHVSGYADGRRGP